MLGQVPRNITYNNNNNNNIYDDNKLMLMLMLMPKIFDFTIIESHTTTSATIYNITTIEYNIAHPWSILDLCEATSWLYDAQYLTSTAFISEYTAVVSVVSHNGVDTAHYGVVYVYVYANDLAQLLYCNIQRLNPYDNNKCNRFALVLRLHLRPMS